PWGGGTDGKAAPGCAASPPRRATPRGFDNLRGNDLQSLWAPRHGAAPPSSRTIRAMENWFSPELDALIREAEQPHAYVALLLIVAALPIAWGIPRLLRGPLPRHGSIIFGGRIFDGVAFPALWLGLAWVARQFCL